MLEGSRAFDIAWGTATGILCLALALLILMAWVWRPEWSLFGMAVDPKRRLQIGWGLVAIGMGFTNFACRYIPHNYLLGVHEGFALITLVITLVLAPRVIPLVVAELRRRRQATTA